MENLLFDKTGFRTSGLRHVPLEKALSGIRNAGYNTVEFCLEHPEASAETLSSVCEHGLEVSSVSYHGKRDSVDVRLREGYRAIDLAVQCGIDTVVFGSPLRDLHSFLHEAELMYKRAVDNSVQPCWETEPGTILDSIREFRSLIVPLGTRAGLNMDAGHLHLQKTCTSREIASLGRRITHVHVEGMKFGEHVHLIPGTGDLNWTEMLTGLLNAGYSGSLTIDLFDLSGDWENFIGRASIALKDILSYYSLSEKSIKRG